MDEKPTPRELINSAKTYAKGFSSDPDKQIKVLFALADTGLVS